MPKTGTNIGYATLSIIPSLDGLSKAVDSQLGGLVSQGKKAGKQLGSGIADGVQQAEAAVKRSTDKIVALQDKQATAADKVRLAEEKLTEAREKGLTGSRLTTAQNAREKALRDEAAALRNVEAETKSLERAQKSLGDAQSLGGKGGKSAGGEFLSGFSDGIAGLGAKAGPIGLGLTAAAGLALAGGSLIAKNVLAGMDQLQDRANFAAALGFTPDQMKPLADAAAKAYAGNFGESIAGNMDAARAAIQSGLLGPGASEKDTQGIVERLTTVSGLLGEGIPATARAAQQAIRTGLAPNAEAAFDLIVKGQQAGINTSEDFLDTLNEYGTQFRKLGLSGPEAVGLISQAMKGGARDSDVAADALKEFSIRAIDGSKTTIDGFSSIGLSADDMREKIAAGGPAAHNALGQVLTGLRNVRDPAEQSRIAVELFGTQAEDLGGALNNFDLSKAVSQLGNVQGAAQRASDTMGGTTASTFESAKRSIETSLDGVQVKLAEAFGPSLTELANAVTTHGNEITGAFLDIASGSTRAIGMTLESFGQLVGGVGNVYGAILRADAAMQHLVGDDKYGTELDHQADAAFGWGKSLQEAGQKLVGASNDMDTFSDHIGDADIKAVNLGHNLGALPSTVPVNVDLKLNAGQGFSIGNAGVSIPVSVGTLPLFGPGTGAGPVPGQGSGRAGGGMLPGYSTTDNMLVPMAGGEGVIKSSVMRKLGAGWLNAINNGYANGGIVGAGPDVLAAEKLAGTPYSQGSRFDCSGTVARVINDALGMPGGGLMTTKNAQAWLSARGFQAGIGGRGAITVGWYDRGPNPNDGHMAMTLSDGENAESGGRNSVFTIGAGAKGGGDSGFDHHMFLALASGQGPATGSAADALKAGSAAVTNPDGGLGGQGAPTGGGGGVGVPSSLSGLATLPFDALTSAGQANSGPGHRDPAAYFPEAASAAIGGQIGSLLGVAGIGDTPGWLKGISQFASGIGVSDKSGNSLFGGGNIFGQGSAVPLSAAPIAAMTPAGTGAPPPADAVHGRRAGQNPGTAGPVFNTTFNTNDDTAFNQWRRWQNERAASKLSRY